MKLELNNEELNDLIDCLQDSINAERDSLHDPESLLSGYYTVESVEELVERFTALQAKLAKHLEQTA